jgi:hypothetical protein
VAADGDKDDHHILQGRWYRVLQDIFQHIPAIAHCYEDATRLVLLGADRSSCSLLKSPSSAPSPRNTIGAKRTFSKPRLQLDYEYAPLRFSPRPKAIINRPMAGRRQASFQSQPSAYRLTGIDRAAGGRSGNVVTVHLDSRSRWPIKAAAAARMKLRLDGAHCIDVRAQLWARHDHLPLEEDDILATRPASCVTWKVTGHRRDTSQGNASKINMLIHRPQARAGLG